MNQKPVNVESTRSYQYVQTPKIGCMIFYLILGINCLFLGIVSINNDFVDLALNERIKLRPGLPPFEKWKDPSGVDINIKLFLFGIENSQEFLANETTKLKLKEIGPIYYKKIMRQEDIVFHEENSTMSFSTVYHLEYNEKVNEPGILNKTLTIYNPVLLTLAAMTHDKFFAKIAFDLVAKKDTVFMNKTVYEILWNNSSPILELAKQIPFAAPRSNAGIMYNSFYPSISRYNVNIGPKHGYENFFKINTLNGVSRINVYRENYPKHCPYSLKGASEGTGLPPRISKNMTIQAFTNNLCRTYPMVFNRTLKFGDLDAYEYVLADDIYKRAEDPEEDCFRETNGVILPSGLIDSSKCAFGTPMALSNPHFWGFHGEWENYLEGLEPSLDAHSSHIIVEPTTGIQLEALVRIQSNLPLPNLKYYPSDIPRFSEMIIPQFWMEYCVNNNDPFIHTMIKIINNMHVIQPIIVIILFVLSVLFIYKSIRLMIVLKAKIKWDASKELETIYSTSTEKYIDAYSHSTERTAL